MSSPPPKKKNKIKKNYGIGSTICIGWEIQCLQYAGFIYIYSWFILDILNMSRYFLGFLRTRKIYCNCLHFLKNIFCICLDVVNISLFSWFFGSYNWKEKCCSAPPPPVAPSLRSGNPLASGLLVGPTAWTAYLGPVASYFLVHI